MSKKTKPDQKEGMEKEKDLQEKKAAVDQEMEEEDKQEEKKSKKGKGKKKQKSCADELEEMKAQYAELYDKHMRLFADFDNYRKNCNKDKIELIKTASQGVIEGILPVLDDFDRAIDAMKAHKSDEESINGVELIYNKLFTFLKQQGLQPMDSQGKEFDTDYHDAITQIPAPSEDLKGKVVDVVQKGYLLNDKIIRHAKVVVGQ
jgi:molecular chaperone GrpE